MPSPSFSHAIGLGVELARGRRKERTKKFTEETVQATLDNGEVIVLGRSLPVTGTVQGRIREGDSVTVAWANEQPKVIVKHRARRAQPPGAIPGGQPLVEELLIAVRPDGVRDVYFRNVENTLALELDRFIPDTSTLSSVGWGATNEWFYTRAGTGVHVFRLNREPDVPFTGDPGESVELDRFEDLTTNPTVLATFLLSPDGSPQTTVITPASPSTQLISLSLAVDGSLIGAFRVLGLYAVAGSNSPAGLASTNAPFTGQPGTLGTTAYPVIADLTNHVILLSAFDDPTFFEPYWTLVDLNNGPRSDAFYFPSTTFTAVFRPTTWVQANTFTVGIDPPFEGHTETDVTWWVGYSETPSSILVSLEPILVLGADVAPALRVRGWVAWAQFEYVVAVGQTNEVGIPGFFVSPTVPEQFIVFPPPPFPVTNQSMALATAPITGVTVELYPIQRPALGFVSAATWHRVLWRKPGGAQYTVLGNFTGGGEAPAFVTLFEGDITTQVSETGRASIGRRGLVVVPPDFLYQLDNPSVALPEDAETLFFVDGWEFGGETTFNTVAAEFPEEFTALDEFKGLADVPEGVTQPTSFGQFSLYVNNDEDTLSEAGAFEERPA